MSGTGTRPRSPVEAASWLDRRGLLAVVVLVAISLAAWVVTVDRMDGMDAGPGTDLGTLGWFTGAWATMMVAMMLPSAAPSVRLFSRIVGRGSATAAFVAGYLAVWIAAGLVAYGLYRLVAAARPGMLAWDRGGPWIAGAAVLAAAAYQLTPLKRTCLRHCRSPLHLLLARPRRGRAGALRMGAEHGAWCTGCCWGLMLVLFAVGVMSVTWMLVVTGLVFAEKVLPGGARLSRGIGLALAVLAIWIAVSPATVPGLTAPAAAGGPQGGPPMDMPMR